MKETITVLVYMLIAASILAMVCVPVELAQEFISSHKAYKSAKALLEHHIRVWTSIAKECDPVAEAYDKGYAIARLVIYHHQLEELENDRKYDLCS